jgi:hypothetical protein
MTEPNLTPPPEAVPYRQTQAEFSSVMDGFLAWFATFATEISGAISWFAAQVTTVTTKAGEAANSASAAASAAAAAEASATAATAVADAWVAGADYAAGETAYSLVDYQTYRAKTDLVGETTDPSADRTNWALQGPDPAQARLFSLWTGA